MNEIATLATRNEKGQLVPTVNGLAIRRNRNTKDITGFEIERRKQYRERLMTQINPKTGQKFTSNEANASHAEYVQMAARELRLKLGAAFTSGELQPDAAAIDPITGRLKTIRLMRPQQDKKVKTAKATHDIAAANNLPQDEVQREVDAAIARLVARRSSEIEAHTTQVPETAGQVSAEPQHVATA